MPYFIERFGSIELPTYNTIEDATPAAPRAAVVATAAGSFDAWGSGRAAQKFPHTLSVRCLVSEDSTANLITTMDALRAAVGTRANLYRRRDDGVVHLCTARLMDMDYQRATRHLRHQELRLVFAQLDPWSGDRYEDWVLDDGSDLDDGLLLDYGALTFSPPTAGELTLGGNLAALDVRLTITFDGADADPCYIVIANSGVCLIVDGPWANADELVIDSQARTITVNGSDAYSRLDVDTGYGAYTHTATEWISLQPGFNSVLVIGATADEATLEYVEAWA